MVTEHRCAVKSHCCCWALGIYCAALVLLVADSSSLRRLIQLWAEPQWAQSRSVAAGDVAANAGALVPCGACGQLLPAQGTACLLAAFTRGFSGALLECRNASWVPFLRAETEAQLVFGSSFVLWGPVETEGTKLLLRMAFDQNGPGAEQLL